MLVVVGSADYLTGHEIQFSIFYLVAVAVAAWAVGTTFAVVISLLSVGAWLVGDLASGRERLCLQELQQLEQP